MAQLIVRTLLASAVGGSIVLAACGGSSGPRKVIINERVCGSAPFVRLKLGEVNRVVLDNHERSQGQTGLTLRLEKFPIVVSGPVPPNSQIGDPTSTVVLTAAPDEVKQVDISPTFTGTHKARCIVAVGDNITNEELTFEIVQ